MTFLVSSKWSQLRYDSYLIYNYNVLHSQFLINIGRKITVHVVK